MTINNRVTLLLGLSAENLRRLPLDQPIVVDMLALEQTTGKRVQDLLLIAGETEDSITAQIRGAIPEMWAEAVRSGRVFGVNG